VPSRNWNDLDRQVARALFGITDKYERRILKEYARAYRDVRGEMAALYTKLKTPDGKLTLAEMTKYHRYATLEKNIAKILNERLGIVIKDFARLKREEYDAAFFRYAWAFDQNSAVAISWGAVPEDALEALIRDPLDLIAHDTLPAVTRGRIRRAIAQGLTVGKSFPQMAKDIQKAMGSAAYEAIRIARTEGQRAMSIGTEAIYDRARAKGIQGQEIWDATLDGVTRPSHRALDGQPRPEDGVWVVAHIAKDNPSGIVRTTGPLMSGVASFDINCRCRRRFQVEGFAPMLRRTRSEGVVPYVSYSDWQPNGLPNPRAFKHQ
tara:strand:+ start:1069 stop:2031 length:963 start_codon:yes stop_codon:yes gene_type:complete